jgi:hypothetical protein
MGLFDGLFAPNIGWLGSALTLAKDESPAGTASPPADNAAAGAPSWAGPLGTVSQLFPPLLLPTHQAAPPSQPGPATIDRAGLDERAYGSAGLPLSPASPQAQTPDLGDRLSNGLLGFLNGRAPLPALGDLIEALATGQRADRRR